MKGSAPSSKSACLSGRSDHREGDADLILSQPEFLLGVPSIHSSQYLDLETLLLLPSDAINEVPVYFQHEGPILISALHALQLNPSSLALRQLREYG